MNEDILFNILLQSNINNIKNYCLLSTISKNICNDKNFWLTKFKIDNIPILYDIIPSTLSQWIKEYTKVLYTQNLSKGLIKVLQEEFLIEQTVTVKIIFDTNDDIINLLPNHLTNKIINNKNYNNINREEQVIKIGIDDYDLKDTFLYYTLYDVFANQLINKSIMLPYKQLSDLLFKILYYYPDIDIRDKNNYSFLYYKIKEEKLLWNVKKHKLYDTRLDLWKRVL